MERSKNPRDSPDHSDRLFKKPRSEKEIAPSLSFGSAARSAAPGGSTFVLVSTITQSTPIFEFASSLSPSGSQGLSNLTSTPLSGQAAPATQQSMIPSADPPRVDTAPAPKENRPNSAARTAPGAAITFDQSPAVCDLSTQKRGSEAAALNTQQDNTKPAESASAATQSGGIEQDWGVTVKAESGSGTPANTCPAQAVDITIKQDKSSETKATNNPLSGQDNLVSGPIESLDVRGDLILIAGETKVNFRVCSRALSRSSRIWEEKLYGPGPFSKQKNHQEEYGWVVCVPKQNPEALRIVLRAVHYQLDKIPARLSREIIFHLAVLCVRYDMVELLKPFWRGWLSRLPPLQPLDSKTFRQQVCIATKLGDLNSFKATILEFLHSAQKCPDDERLFLDADITYLYKHPYSGKSSLMGRLEFARSKAIKEISGRVNAAIDGLSEPATTNCACHYNNLDWGKTCDCAMLGGVLRALRGKPWYSSGKSDWAELVTLSVRQLVAKVEGIRTGAIGESRMRRKQGNAHKDCTPWARFEIGDILGEHNFATYFHVNEDVFHQQAKKSGLSTSAASHQPVSASASVFA